MRPTSGTLTSNMHLRDGPPQHLGLKANSAYIHETHEVTVNQKAILKGLMQAHRG